MVDYKYKTSIKDIQDKYKFKLFGYDLSGASIKEYNDNATSKLNEYNSNHTTKLSEYNSNATTKLSDYNTNAEAKTTTFNNNAESYEKRIEHYKKYSNALIHEEQVGTELTFDNTAESPMEVTLFGNTSQETTTGKNLFDEDNYNWYAGYLQSGNGNTYPDNSSLMPLEYIEVSPSTDYTLSFKYGNSANSFSKMYAFYTEDKTFISRLYPTSSTTIYSFTTPNNAKYIRICWYKLRLNNVDTSVDITNVNNYIYDIQLEEGTTATEYEPYTNGASPNPDYPQKIKVVKGDNEIVVCNKNLYNKNSENNIQNYFLSGEDFNTLIANNNYTVSEFIKVKENTQYTISGNNPSGANYGFYDKNKNVLGGGATNRTGNTFTTIANTVYFRMEVRKNYLDTAQLEQGSVASDYVEHKETSYPIILGVENLLDLSQGFRNGYLNTSTGEFVSENVSYVLNYYIPVVGGQTYTYSTNHDMRNICIYSFDENKNYIKREAVASNTKICTATLDSNARFVQLGGAYSSSTTITQSLLESLNLQLEQGPIVHSYSPYGQTPIEMCKIGDYKDTFVKESGVWYKKEVIGKVILDGTESWGSYDEGNNIINMFLNTDEGILKNIADNHILCTHFKPIFVLSREDGVIYAYPSLNEKISIFVSTKREISNLNNFKTWLSQSNVTIYYPITSQLIEITDTTLISQLDNILYALSYEGQTNITQVNSELPFELDIDTVKDLNVIITNINNAIIEIGGE